MMIWRLFRLIFHLPLLRLRLFHSHPQLLAVRGAGDEADSEGMGIMFCS